MNSSHLIQGPVIPLPTPFNADESVDLNGLAQYVEFLSDGKIPAVMSTVGTSRYNLLSWEEMRDINRTVASSVKPGTQSIVTSPTTGGLRHMIEFGKHAEQIGADYYLVYFPERHYSEENTYQFFKALCDELSIRILIHEMPMRNGVGPGAKQYSLDLLGRLFALDNIVGVKEEALDPDYSNQILDHYADRVLMIGAGGGMSRYLKRDHNRGAQAFLGGLGNFVPEVELEFYQHLTEGRTEQAARIVHEVEAAYFEAVVPMGWHPTLKSALHHLGLMQVHERRPMVQLSVEEHGRVKAILQQLGWL